MDHRIRDIHPVSLLKPRRQSLRQAAHAASKIKRFSFVEGNAIAFHFIEKKLYGSRPLGKKIIQTPFSALFIIMT